MMTDPSLIADLVRAGVDAELVGRVANALLAARMALDECRVDSQVDTAADRRRKWDREYKKAKRQLGFSAGKQTMSGARMSGGQSGGHKAVTPNDSGLSIESQTLQGKKESLSEKKEEVVEGRNKGTRLADDWKPSETDRDFARAAGLNERQIDHAAAEFVDYWTAIPGQRGRKTKWPNVWRNRVRAIATPAKDKPNGKRSVHDAAADLLERVRAFDQPAPSDLRDRTGAGAVRRVSSG